MDMQVMKVEIAKLEMKPGDVLVVSVPDQLAAHAIEQVGDALNKLMPPNTRALVIPERMKLSVVTPIDREDETRV